MEDLFTNRMEIFGEILNLLLMYHVLLFTDFVGDVDMRYNIGYSFILYIAIFICIHLYFMLRGTYKDAVHAARVKNKKRNDSAAHKLKQEERMNAFLERVERFKETAGPNADAEFMAELEEIAELQTWDQMEVRIARSKDMRARRKAFTAFQRDLEKKLAKDRKALRIMESESSPSEYDDEEDYYEELPEHREVHLKIAQSKHEFERKQ